MSTPITSDDRSPLDENDMLAAEYALGVLDLAERAHVEAMAKSSPAFAARIAAWEARLAPMADDIDPIAPPPNLLPQIEARLFAAPPHAAPMAQLRARFALPQGWWRGVLGTGGMAAVSVLVIAGIVQFTNMPITDSDRADPSSTAQQTPDQSAVQTITLLAEGSDLIYRVQRASGQITLTRTAGAPAPSNRSYELWVINGDAAPVSLGLIDASLTLPEPPIAGYVLAITDEPFGGGPNGVATGPVLALGKFDES
jgi:anti-sigma-K factor RskA